MTASHLIASIYLVEIWIIYAILYLICYKWLKLHHKYSDSKTVFWLYIISCVLSLVFLNPSISLFIFLYNL